MSLPPPRRPRSEGGNFPPVAPSKKSLRDAFADKDALKASCDAASQRAEGKAGAKFGHHLVASASSIDVEVGATQCDAAMLNYKEVNKIDARKT